ncbi:MAG: MMPL family transporter [Eubacteriales bacterium]|nr:MMPL family transporter [Eubacteriales bacterium]
MNENDAKKKQKKKGFSLPAFIVRYAGPIEKLFILLTLLSLFLMPFVRVNYDLTKYLPESAQSKKGLDLMEEEFGYPGTARVMIDGVTLYEAKAYKDQIEAIDGVDTVMWCDTSTDIYSSSDFIHYEDITDYYKDGAAVMDLTFDYGDSDKRTEAAIDEISELLGDKGYMVGMAVQNKSLTENVSRELNTILAVAIVVIFLILMLTTTAWTEPVLFLAVMGVAIIINKGTNVFLGTVSFLTDNVVAVLQLAVSMDYSIFLLHAYTRYKEQGMPMNEALTAAINEAINTILASSLTTIVGFIVLTVMKFRIGFDLGLSLTKGVALSLIAVLFFMPALIIRMAPSLEKTEHRSFLPTFDRTAKAIYRIRKPVFLAIILLAVPLYMAQSMNTFVYGNAAVGASEGTKVYEDEQKIREKFGRSNMMIAIVPNSSNVVEKEFAEELSDLPYMKGVMALSDEVPAGVPESFLPESITGLLHTEDYARILMYTRTKEESAAAYAASDEIQAIMQKYYPEGAYLVGGTPSTQDIQTTITKDYNFVNILSMLGVFLVVMFNFKSLATPIAVMIPIEVAIFLNMAIPYFGGEEVNYIGYIIVSCIQLGATVDYSILTTSNYLEARNKFRLDKKEAAIWTLKRSIPAILTSGSILTACGYILYLISSISAIGGLGHLVGRGAWMSVAMVLCVLPALLVMVDPLIEENELDRLKGLLKKLRAPRIRGKKAAQAEEDAGKAAETDAEKQSVGENHEQEGKGRNDG